MSNFVAKNVQEPEYPPTEIAIVGFGYWGRIIANNLDSARCVNIKYIVDNFEPNRDAANASYPNVAAVEQLAQALQDDELDLVVIATPTDSHFNIAVETLAAGKHVFVEKPFVRRLDEAFELKLLAKKVDRHIFVDHTFVFTNEVQEVK
ncbi:MAG: Gfo/Idh/MocA family oxidoreductase, partial [Verrucomicrobiota bacterium]